MHARYLAAIEKRRRRLEAYLNYLLHYEEYRNHSEMVSLFAKKQRDS